MSTSGEVLGIVAFILGVLALTALVSVAAWLVRVTRPRGNADLELVCDACSSTVGWYATPTDALTAWNRHRVARHPGDRVRGRVKR